MAQSSQLFLEKTYMNTNKDDRFKNPNDTKRNESRPASPTSGTADNESVYKQPPIEQATKDGKADKMDENSSEDRKHTPWCGIGLVIEPRWFKY